MGGQAEPWRANIPMAEYVRELGIRLTGERRGLWVRGHCPAHDDKSPSLELVVDGSSEYAPGTWICYAGCGKGALEHLIAKVRGMPAQHARDTLREKHDKTWKGSPREPAAMSTAEQVKTWQMWLFSKDEHHGGREALAYLKAHAISEETARDFGLGVENFRLMIPIRDRNGVIVQMKKRAIDKRAVNWKQKDLCIAGHGAWLFPMHVYRFQDQPVVCEGEPDCLALRELGFNAVTCTTGAGQWNTDTFWPIIKTGPASTMTLVPDRDASGQKAWTKFARECVDKEGVALVRIVVVPDPFKDVAEWLASLSPSEREAAMLEAIKTARIFGKNDRWWNDVHTQDGAIFRVEKDAEVQLAPWSGVIAESGIERNGTGNAAGHGYMLKLRHKNGSEADVYHREGESFIGSLMSTKGVKSDWRIETKYADFVFTYLCQTSPDPIHVDHGWFFGWEGQDRTRFWTKDYVFLQGGLVVPNTEIKMRAPHPLMAEMALPLTTGETVRQSMQLVLERLLYAHEAEVMMPLVVNAFAAPIRRLALPNEARWAVYMVGPTGCGKTSRARLAQSFFGSYPTDNKLLAWDSTATSVEHLAGHAGDSLLLIDDLAEDKMGEREWTTARRFLQGVAQGIGRTRMTGKGEMIVPIEPSSLVLVTAEVLPTADQGQIARSLVIRVPDIHPLDDQWRLPCNDAIAEQALLPHAMSGWVQWWMGEGMVLAGFPARLEEAMGMTVAAMNATVPDWTTQRNSSRVANRLAALTAIWREVLAYGEACGAIGSAQMMALLSIWTDHVLPSLAFNNIAAVAESGVAQDLMTQICSQLQGGRACLVDQDGQKWPRSSSPTSVTIGYLDRDRGAMSEKSAKQVDCLVMWFGRPTQVFLYSSVATIMRGQWRWPSMKTFLVDNKFAVDRIAKLFDSKQRALPLTRMGAEVLLGCLATPGQQEAEQRSTSLG